MWGIIKGLGPCDEIAHELPRRELMRTSIGGFTFFSFPRDRLTYFSAMLHGPLFSAYLALHPLLPHWGS